MKAQIAEARLRGDIETRAWLSSASLPPPSPTRSLARPTRNRLHLRRLPPSLFASNYRRCLEFSPGIVSPRASVSESCSPKFYLPRSISVCSLAVPPCNNYYPNAQPPRLPRKNAKLATRCYAASTFAKFIPRLSRQFIPLHRSYTRNV